MNRDTATVPLFSATRRSHALGLILAGAVFAVIGLGGSGAIVRSFVTAGTFASAPAPTAPQAG
ncbi:MAG TPA: hypothetical protein VMH40_04280 [Myxococcaceae bacterium]|nr:hypothetical protein [Myxococcaceae bacterium]